MKSMLIVLAAAGGMLLVTATATASEDAFKGAGCQTCHDLEKKKMGPSLKELRATHKPDKLTIDSYATKLMEGKGHPKRKGTEVEIKAAITYALGGK